MPPPSLPSWNGYWLMLDVVCTVLLICTSYYGRELVALLYCMSTIVLGGSCCPTHIWVGRRVGASEHSRRELGMIFSRQDRGYKCTLHPILVRSGCSTAWIAMMPWRWDCMEEAILPPHENDIQQRQRWHKWRHSSKHSGSSHIILKGHRASFWAVRIIPLLLGF